jgi:hypothetical protein
MKRKTRPYILVKDFDLFFFEAKHAYIAGSKIMLQAENERSMLSG